MRISIKPIDGLRRTDFYQVHSKENGEGWCNCVAWWVPTWDGWEERSADENRILRDSLFDRGEFDGYLLYVNEKPVGWCQCGPRDRLAKLVSQSKLEPSPETWAVTCFVIIPAHRQKGLTHVFLKEILADLREKGIQHVQAFPKCGQGLGDGEVWTGPESLFIKAGFDIERMHPQWPIYGKWLNPASGKT
ncbi:MAG: GNAT family N-acetyltransferase [Bdellovibrio sp.]|nr:GNAT family N-acetyltransferase [Bdellovibrio sp.]